MNIILKFILRLIAITMSGYGLYLIIWFLIYAPKRFPEEIFGGILLIYLSIIPLILSKGKLSDSF